MKKLSFILALIIALTGMIGLFATSVSAAEDAGYTYDKATDTYTVTTVDGYIAVVALMNGTSQATANLDATLKLGANLDFTGVVFPVIALGNANGYFTGTFDGNGYTMSNISIDKTGVSRVGIVGESAGGTFKNITVVNSTVIGNEYVSLFVGDVRSGTAPVTFENCHIKNVTIDAQKYGATFATTNTSPLTIKNCTVDNAVVSAPVGHAAALFHERGNTVGIALTVENVVMSGTATSGGNAGGFGYICDANLTVNNLITTVKATGSAASSLLCSAKRCAVTMNNVVCVDSPIAAADALGEKAVNDFVLNNVVVLADEAPKAFKKFAVKGPYSATLTIDGLAAEFATATIPATTADAAATMIRANLIGALKVAALKAIGVEPTAEDLQGYTYKDNTYYVENANGLVAVVGLINGGKNDANIILVADIFMNETTTAWKPICDVAKALYVGTVDGQGHSIYNFKDDTTTGARRAFIGRAGNCTVKNLTFVDPVVAGGKLTAIIIGDIRLEGAKPALTTSDVVTIENCHIINGKVSSTSRENVGAFVGGNSTAAGLVIKNSTVIADVSTAKYGAGLLIGGEENSVALNYTFENIFAVGTVTAAENVASAGLIGKIDGANITMTNVVTNVAPLGDITLANNAVTFTNVVAHGNVTVDVFNNVAVTEGTTNTLTIDGVAATEIVGAKMPAAECQVAQAKAIELFPNNAVVNAVAKNIFVHQVSDEYSSNETQHWFACTICGNNTPVDHVFDQLIETEDYLKNDVSCTAAKTYYKSCVCGVKGTETFTVGSVLPHVYDQKVIEDKYLADAATCTAPATYHYSCVCGSKGADTFVYGEALGHTFTAEVAEEAYLNTPATCTAQATYFKSCAVCGEKGEETFAYGELAAHVFDQQVVADAYLEIGATCITPAEYYYSCVCGHKGEEIFTVEGFVDHVYGDWYVAVEPSINAEGTMEKACTVCGDKQTEVIPSTITNVKDTVVGTAGAVKDKVAGTLGCGGSIGGTSIIIMIAAAGAVIARKKKED